ncbi:hypothetical protein [Streptomyces palmae]|uniref:Uncharacterized protein n=1 Tax=Streptomyces palmae TaxID=1701085 RepID=A0A4Z0HAN7_9ACTN|nr:hypothetical protein [Streptomyces palmae]TGB15562.1 hypothetical protein E4099_06630 [Streptomyces palmae]
MREVVRITADSAADDGSNHRFTLVGRSGKLKETLDYDGSDPEWKVGDRIEVISDPEGTVPLGAAFDVDPEGRLGTLLLVIGWTGITLLAGRRGFLRRRAGRRPAFEDVD